jgi:tetratricopeptide (TPR) repeat protein
MRLTWSPKPALSVVVCSAFLVRALALWCDRGGLLFETGGLDADQYLAMARGFSSGEWPAAQPFFWAPGYSLFLSLLAVVSKSALWFKLVQIGVGTATCALVARLAWLLFEDLRAATLAAGFASFYGPLVYYDIQISPATLDVFLSVLMLVFLLELRRRPGVWFWALCSGCCAAASALTRGGVLLVLPLTLIWVWTLPSGRRTKLACCLALALPVATSIGLVCAHNFRHDSAIHRALDGEVSEPSRGLVLISYNLGINFLLGNHPELYATNDVEHPMCFVSYKMVHDEPERHGALSGSAHSRFLFRKAVDQIRLHPGEWLRLMGHKVQELIRGEEISRDASIYAHRLENPVIAALIWKYGLAFPTGLLMPFAFLGASLAGLERRRLVLLAMYLGTQAIFVLGFFVTTRYRLPLCTVAMPLAAHGLLAGLGRLRPIAAPRLYTCLVITAGLLLLCNSGLRKLPKNHFPFEYSHLGQVLSERGEPEAAARNWRTALAIDPGYVPVHFQLAGYYRSMGDFESAAAYFESGLRLAPTAYPAREDYADLLLQQGRTSAALRQLEIGLAHAPGVRAQLRACRIGERLNVYVSPACYLGHASLSEAGAAGKTVVSSTRGRAGSPE